MKKFRQNANLTETAECAATIIRVFKSYGALSDDMYLVNVISKIESLCDRLTAAINGDRVVSTLKDADSARDTAVKNVGTLLAGYAVHPDSAKQTAAMRLLVVFDKYKSITEANYASRSSLVESMLEDFASPLYKDNLLLLDGVELLIARVRETQDSFNVAEDGYVMALSKTGEQEKATSIKQAMIITINAELLPYLDAMALSARERYGAFATELATVILHMNEGVDMRPKRKKAL